MVSTYRKIGFCRFLLVGILALLFFSSRAGAETVTIRFWYEWGGRLKDYMNFCAERFEKENPGIKVETLHVPDMNQKLLPAIAGGVPPDAVVFNRPHIAKWASENTFTPLDDLIQKNHIHAESFLETCWDECVFNGHTWGIPFNTDNRMLYWNKQVFREAGLDPDTPPRTWDELDQMADQLTLYDDSGKLVRLGFYPLWGVGGFYLFGSQNGVDFISADGRTALFNGPQGVATLEWFVRYARKYNIQLMTAFKLGFGPQAQNPFITGKVAMYVDGNWRPDYWRQYAPGLEFGTAPPPIPKGGKLLSWGGGMALVIPRAAKQPDAAMQYIRYLVSPRVQEEVGRLHTIPALKIAIDTIKVDMTDDWQISAAMMEHTIHMPKTPVQDELVYAMDRACEEAVYGWKSSQQALQDAARSVQQALDRFHARDQYPLIPWRLVWFGLVSLFLLVVLLTLFFTRDKLRLGLFGREEAFEGYLFASPWIIGFLVFTLGPIVFSFLISFCDYPILSPARWVGPSNYENLLFDDELFWKSLYNTFYYTLFHVPLGIMLAMFLAVLLNQQVRGIGFFRTIFYLPSVIAGVAVSVLWMWILNPEYGLLNAFLEMLGVKGPGWLADVNWSKPAIILMSMWGVGAGMIIFLAALQGIPRQLYESATIDGAGMLAQFRHITIPLLTPAIFFNVVIGIIHSFQVFTQAYVMTNGGPMDSTLFYALYLFRLSFQYFRMGYASAMAWILFAIILMVTLCQIYLSKRWVYYESETDR